VRHDKITDFNLLNRSIAKFGQDHIASREAGGSSDQKVNCSHIIFSLYFREVSEVRNGTGIRQFVDLFRPAFPHLAVFLVDRFGGVERVNGFCCVEALLKHRARERLDFREKDGSPSEFSPCEACGFNAGADRGVSHLSSSLRLSK
jgi:hypothetical protein